jgi:endonuclease/exonuclease/phosphatase family metal-dependent hydrolase
MKVNILTYNIAMGLARNSANNKKLLPILDSLELLKIRIYELIKDREHEIWLFCLQEIHRDYGNRNIAHELRDYLELSTNRTWHCRTTTYLPYSSNPYRGAVAIITNKKQLNISDPKETHWLPPDIRFPISLKNLRGAVAYKMEINAQNKLWIINTHLASAKTDLNFSKRIESLKYIINRINHYVLSNESVILCGDFNIVDVDEKSYGKKPKMLDENLYNQTIGVLTAMGYYRGDGYMSNPDNSTHPAWANRKNPKGTWKVIDYIFFKGNTTSWRARAPQVITVSSLDNKYLSDHNLIYMKLEFTN